MKLRKKLREDLEKAEFEYVRLFVQSLRRRNTMHREAMKLEKKRKVNYVS